MFNMASNRPVTFEDLVHAQADRNAEEFELRPHTLVYRAETMDHFAVFLYGSRIAEVHADAVRVFRPQPTATTKNRVNDFLLPLGWKVAVRNGKWHVQTTVPPYRSMEFHNGMILSTLTNVSKEA